MLSAAAARLAARSRVPPVRNIAAAAAASHLHLHPRPTSARRIIIAGRFLSSSSSSSSSKEDDKDSVMDGILKYSPPEKLTSEMANGIADATRFYVRCGLPHQRLKALAADDDLPVVQKWQQMMETFLACQIHVIAGMGYTGSEEALTRYAQDLNDCIQSSDPETAERLGNVRRETWRDLVATGFGLDATEIPTLSIVEARDLMHKVSSKMMEPDTLLEINQMASKIDDPEPERAVAKKHEILQQIIVEKVYLGGSPSLAEEAGFGSGPQAYAKLQCAMSDYEGDPLISQYATAAMTKIWEAAGMDMSALPGGPAA